MKPITYRIPGRSFTIAPQQHPDGSWTASVASDLREGTWDIDGTFDSANEATQCAKIKILERRVTNYRAVIDDVNDRLRTLEELLADALARRGQS